ncbi:MAG TPA: DUF4142 domain-containing protein [Burkholderiaceae bacterium]|nr:DUF4142 domain-containing protein [Burkholderiaceae bacterium]
MLDRIFRRTQLSTLLGFATAAMMLSAAPVHSQTSPPPDTTSQGATTSSQSSPDTAGQSDQSGMSSSGAASSGTSDSSGTSASGTSGTDTSGSAATATDSEKAATAGTAQASVSSSDRNLMRQLAYANLSEISVAKLAQEKSKNDDVRTFAQHMLDDHTKALEQLQQLAQAKGVQLPTEPDAKHKAMEKRLSALSGDAFDKRYMRDAGLTDHRNARRLVARASERAQDPDLKAMAQEQLPGIDQHLQMAQSIRSGKGIGATSSTGGTSSYGGAAGSSDSSGSSDTGGTSGSSGK